MYDKIRRVVILATALAVTAAFPSVVYGQDAKTEAKERQKIVIIESKEGTTPDRLREFRVVRGPNGEITLPEGCNDGETAADVKEESGDKRSRLFVCAPGAGAPSERLAALEKVLDRLRKEDHLSAETRQRVRLKIEEEIGRLRSSN